QVEQVIHDQEIIALDVEVASFDHAPLWVVHPVPVRYQRIVGACGITHPHPDPFPALYCRKGTYTRPWRDPVLGRHVDAFARRSEGQPVIATLKIVAHDLSKRKRRMPVAAAILEGHGCPVLPAEKNDRLIQ